MSDLDLKPIPVADVPRLALREAEAAEALGVSASWLRRETARGSVPSIRVSGNRLYPVEAIRRWLIEQVQIDESSGNSTQHGSQHPGPRT